MSKPLSIPAQPTIRLHAANVLPTPLLRRLGVEVWRIGTFSLADGRSVQRELGQTWVRINGEEATAPVVFGDEGVQPLLGAITLEIFGVSIDPVGMRLIPLNGLMIAATDASARK